MIDTELQIYMYISGFYTNMKELKVVEVWLT